MANPPDKTTAKPLPVIRSRWRWVLLAGIAVSILSLLLTRLLGGLCSGLAHAIPSLYKQDWHVTIDICRTMPNLYGCEPGVGLLTGRQIADTCELAAAWAGPLINVLLTFGAAVWVTRRLGMVTVLHGVGVGLVSALAGLIALALYGLAVSLWAGAQAVWNLAMLTLAIGGGWLGGVVGQSTLAERQALHQTSRAIGAATSPQAIVAAIGEYLAGPEGNQVSLWRVAPQADEGTLAELDLVAAWAPPGVQAPPPGMSLETAQVSSLARLGQKAPLWIRVREAPPGERAVWARLGIQSALLLPLTSAGDRLTGVLLVAAQTDRDLRRGIWRTELLSGQVALALENLRLVERARQAAVLDERQRLAREIHDTLAQGFTSIVMHLEAAEAALPDRSHKDTALILQHLDQARRTARESLAQARRLVWALRPEILEQASLPTAVERVVAHWAEESSIAASTTITGAIRPLLPAVEVALLRGTQEALANVRKHAQAGQVSVTLSYMGDMVVLDVQDNGIGLDPSWLNAPPLTQTASGFGLTAMRERVEQLGGTLLVESVAGEGTTLVVEIPISAHP